VNVDLGIGLNLDPEGAGGIRRTGPYPGPGHPGYHDISFLVLLLNLGDGAHRGITTGHPRNQNEAIVGLGRGGEGDFSLGGLDAEGHHHVGEDHSVAKRQDGKGLGIGVLGQERSWIGNLRLKTFSRGAIFLVGGI
jgi:hypothetical protein